MNTHQQEIKKKLKDDDLAKQRILDEKDDQIQKARYDIKLREMSDRKNKMLRTKDANLAMMEIK